MPSNFLSFVSKLRTNLFGRRKQEKRHRQRPRVNRLRLEQLEDRWVPADVFWTGAAMDSDWANSLNWTGGTGTPGSGDVAIFNGSSVGGASIDVAVSVQGIELRSGFTGLVSANEDVTIGVGGLTVQAGTLNFTSLVDVSVAGNVAVSGGTLTGPRSGSVFNITGDFTQTGGKYNAGNLSTSNGNVNIDGSFSQTAGEFNAQAATITVGGDWTQSGTFNKVNSTVVLNAAAGTQLLSAASKFHNLTHSGAGTLQLTGALTEATNVLTNSNGTLDLNGKNLTLSGALNNFSNSGTVKANGSSTITGLDNDDDSGTWQITGNATISSTFPGSFFDLTVDSGVTLSVGTGLTVAGTLENLGTIQLVGDETVTLANGNDVDSGTWKYVGLTSPADQSYNIKNFNLGTGNDYFNLVFADTYAGLPEDASSFNLVGNLYLAGSFTNQAGKFSAQSFTVTFTNASTQQLDSGGVSPFVRSDFANIDHTGAGALEITNDLTQLNGSIKNAVGAGAINVLSNYDLLSFGDLTVEGGSFGVGTGEISFDGNLAITGGSVSLATATSVDVGGNVIVGAGAALTAPASSFDVLGDWQVDAAGTFTHSNGTVTFLGTTQSVATGGAGNAFYNLIHSGSGTLSAATIASVAADLFVEGTLTNSSGVLDLSTLTAGNLSITGGTVDAEDALGVYVAADVTVGAGGTLEAPASGAFHVGDDWDSTLGTFHHNNGTVTFNGTGTQTLASKTAADCSVENQLLQLQKANPTAAISPLISCE